MGQAPVLRSIIVESKMVLKPSAETQKAASQAVRNSFFEGIPNQSVCVAWVEWVEWVELCVASVPPFLLFDGGLEARLFADARRPPSMALNLIWSPGAPPSWCSLARRRAFGEVQAPIKQEIGGRRVFGNHVSGRESR